MRHYVYEIVNKDELIGRYTHFVDLPDDAPAPPNSTKFQPKLNENLDTYFHLVGWQWGPKYEDITDQHVWFAFVNRINAEASRMIAQASEGTPPFIVQLWPGIAAEATVVVAGGQSSAIDMMAKSDGRGISSLDYAVEFLQRYNAYVLRVAEIAGARHGILSTTKVEDIPRITKEVLVG